MKEGTSAVLLQSGLDDQIPHSRKRTGGILSEPTHMEDEYEDQEDEVEDERDCEECRVESPRGIRTHNHSSE